MLRYVMHTLSSLFRALGNVRWAAPELYRISEDDSVPTVSKYSDIYSFGSVMLEVRF